MAFVKDFGYALIFSFISKARRHGKWSESFVTKIAVLYFGIRSLNLQIIWSINVQPFFVNLVGSVIVDISSSVVNSSSRN